MARPKGIGKQVAQEVRELYAQDRYTQAELARLFGVSQSTICKIINNYIYKAPGLKLGGEASIRVGIKYGNTG
jgi:DNA-binding XRE family transcriptional regulator